LVIAGQTSAGQNREVESSVVMTMWTDVELVSSESVDHVAAPLSRATVHECDVYFFDEESYSVDVVCDVRQLLVELSASQYSTEERVTSESVQLDASEVAETTTTMTTTASDVEQTGVDVAARHRSTETFVLPQVCSSRTPTRPYRDQLASVTLCVCVSVLLKKNDLSCQHRTW